MLGIVHYALITDECHSKDIEEQKADLQTSSHRSSEKVSCGTRSRASGCYVVLFLLNSFSFSVNHVFL